MFYQYLKTVSGDITAIWIADYNTSFNNLQGPDGYYQQFLSHIKVPSDGVWPASTTYTSIASDESIMSALNNNFLNTTDYMRTLQDLSTAVVPVDCSSNCYQAVTQTTLTSVQMIGSENSATMQLYQALYQQLQNQMPVPGTQASNISPFFDQYNDTLMAIYQQNVAALQEAYMIEATMNYLNYVNGQNNGGNSQIDGPEDISEIGYSYSGQDTQTEQQALTDAQVALAKLYAARVNALLMTTMQFIVTDDFHACYPLPTPAPSSDPLINVWINNHPYSNVLQRARPAWGFPGTTSKQVMPVIQGANWGFYTYGGINQYYTCAENLRANEKANPSDPAPLTSDTCPPMLPALNGATWDGVNYSVYLCEFNTNSQQLTPTVDVTTVSTYPSAPLTLTYGTVDSQQVAALLPTDPNSNWPTVADGNPIATVPLTFIETMYSFNEQLLLGYPGSDQFQLKKFSATPSIQEIPDNNGGTIQSVPPDNFTIANALVFTGSDSIPAEHIFYVVGDNVSSYWESRYSITVNAGLLCNKYDPLCTASSAGLCIAGNAISIAPGNDNTEGNWVMNAIISIGGACSQ